MADASTLLAPVFGAASAVAFTYVGVTLARRPLPAAHRAAGRAFASAWLAAAAISALNAFVGAAGAGTEIGPRLALASVWANLVLGVAVVAGVVGYLAYLTTGSRFAVPLVALVYLGQLFALVLVVLRFGPQGAASSGWTTQFVFASGSPQINVGIALALFVPAGLASASYLAMLAKATDATARWRISLVGGGLTLWCSVAVLARLAPSTGTIGLARVAGTLLALAALLAYAPPAWARRRWRIESVRGEIPRRRPDPRERAARDAAQAARVRDLL